MALKRITGLWAKSGSAGQFWAGDTREAIPAGSKLLVFPNQKRSDSDPDYTVSLIVDEPGSGHGNTPSRSTRPTRRTAEKPVTADDRRRVESFNREVQDSATGYDEPPF